MAKITRQTAKLFGDTANASQIAEFGSLAASLPVTYSGSQAITNVSTIQAANWTTGWFSAVEGAYSPAIEDLNAYCFMMAYQAAYLLQQGVPEWDSGTTYFTNSMASSGGQIYVSLQNSNTNNAVSSASWWQVVTPPSTITSYTPVVTPTAGTFTPTGAGYVANYQQVGKIVTVTFSFNFVQSGTTAVDFTATLPTTSATILAGGAGQAFFTCLNSTTNNWFTVLATIGSNAPTISIQGGSTNIWSVNGHGSGSLSDFNNGTWGVGGTISYITA